MIKRILVGIDDSAVALRAADLAIELATALGAELAVVTVMADHVLDQLLAAAAVPDAARRRAASAMTVLDRVTAQAAAAGLRADATVLTGPAAAKLLAKARIGAADLIVVGAEPAETARHLIEFSEVPVLVAK